MKTVNKWAPGLLALIIFTMIGSIAVSYSTLNSINKYEDKFGKLTEYKTTKCISWRRDASNTRYLFVRTPGNKYVLLTSETEEDAKLITGN